MILGLPFTDVVVFDIRTHLAKNHWQLNKLDFTRQAEIQKAHRHLKNEGLDVSKVRRVQSATLAGDYTSIQMKPRAPLGEAD